MVAIDHERRAGLDRRRDAPFGKPQGVHVAAHEPQGWYGVFDTDASTLALVAAQAKAMQAIG